MTKINTSRVGRNKRDRKRIVLEMQTISDLLFTAYGPKGIRNFEMAIHGLHTEPAVALEIAQAAQKAVNNAVGKVLKKRLDEWATSLEADPAFTTGLGAWAVLKENIGLALDRKGTLEWERGFQQKEPV